MQPQRITVRNLLPTDTIPFASLARGGVPVGFEGLPLDPEWTWVALLDNTVIALLIAGQCQSLLILLRIAVTSTAPPSTPLLLLRRAFRDAKRRGSIGFLTFLTDSAAAESHLMRIVQRANGGLLPSSGAWAFGNF